MEMEHKLVQEGSRVRRSLTRGSYGLYCLCSLYCKKRI